MKEIKQFIQKQGYQYIGKSAMGLDMFEKGQSIIYIQKCTFKRQKKETFKQRTNKMYK